MKYFIPEWDDRVDPGYDFVNDQHSLAHKADLMTNDVYMWDLIGNDQIPFDGLLVSIATLKENPRKLKNIQAKGIHGFFDLPQQYKIMADCGAFSYVDKTMPPYDPIAVLQIYSELGFDFGVSVDHLVVPQFNDQKFDRMRITYENGLKSYEAWSKKYHDQFQLIVAVQGDQVDDYIRMYEKYLDHGIDHLAFGSLVRKQTSFITHLIDQVIERIRKTGRQPMHIHFFGISRFALLHKFKELEETGVEVSFDSASFLRKAWLSSASSQSNYVTRDGIGYSAIRIPFVFDKADNPKTLQVIASDVLSQLRLFDHGIASIEDTIVKLNAFCKASGQPDRTIELYRRTLTETPWKQCPCPICQDIGIDVVIFRGNNRNRRRGFHNVCSFYHILQNEELWENLAERNKQVKALKSPMKSVDNLNFLNNQKGRILIITSCTKKKLSIDDSISAQAQDMYQGNLFRFVRRYAERNGFDYLIISAKYGLLTPHQVIDGYEFMIHNHEDIERIRPQVERELQKVLGRYDTILVIAGEKYRMVLRNIIDDRFVYLKSGGIGDLCSKVNRAIPGKNLTLDTYI